MGGLGSGRWYRGDVRETTDSYHKLDVRAFHRKRLLTHGYSGASRWWRGERQTGEIAWWTVSEDDRVTALTLAYSVAGESIAEPVPLTWTPCHYGGERPWFVCPGCERRVAVLYGGKRFRCRHCRRLVYESTREQETSRYLHKAQQIRTKLGGSASIYEPFPIKPKGMHWRTYQRLRRQADAAELASHLTLMEWLDKMDGRLERLRG